MKKLISILLTAVMIAGLFTVNVSATSLAENRVKQLELNLFEDIFVTKALDKNLYYAAANTTTPNEAAYKETIYPYKGLIVSGDNAVSTIKWNAKRTSSAVGLLINDTDVSDCTATIASQVTAGNLVLKDDGRYDFTVAGTTYHLGKISETEKTGNVFFPGQVYDTSWSNNATIKSEVLDSAYTQNEDTKAVTSATYTINTEDGSGLKSVNLLAATFINHKVNNKVGFGAERTLSELMPVTVTYDDDSTEKYYIATGSIYLDFNTALRKAGKNQALSVSTNTLVYSADTSVVPVCDTSDMTLFLGKTFTVNDKKILMPAGSKVLANHNRLSLTKLDGQYGGYGYTYSYEIPVAAGKTVSSVTVSQPEVITATTFGADNVVSSGYYGYLKLPVEDANYDYYLSAYTRNGSYKHSGLFAITLKYLSYNEKIKAVNDLIDALDESTVKPADITAIQGKIDALKAENADINDSYFKIDRLNELSTYLETQVGKKLDEFRASVSQLGDTYILDMKETVEVIKADYDFLSANLKDEEIGMDTLNKFNAIYKQYEEALAFEDEVSKWTSYEYKMYDDVKAANEKLETLNGAIAPKTVEKVEEFWKIADSANKIDEKIESFGTTYDSSMLEDLLETEKEINIFYETGTREALEHIETFEKLLELASADVLDKDISNVEERITALPAVYTTAVKGEIAEIQAAIISIEERHGQIDSTLEDKLNLLVSQMNEAPLHIPIELEYTRDIFEDMNLYGAQSIFDDDNNTYIYPTGSWGLAVSAINSTTKRAFDENEFVDKLGIDGENKATINGIPYQFGVIKSAVHGVENEPNSIYSGDCGGEIIIDVQDAPYSELYMAAWSGLTNNVPVTITYHYSDGTTSTEVNMTKFKGGTTLPKLDDYTKALYDGTIRMWRASNGTDKWGAYNSVAIAHKLTPDDTKILDSIIITTSGKEINIFALTGITSNSGIMTASLEKIMTKLEKTDDAAEIRELIENADNMISLIEEKGAGYNSQYKAIIDELKEKYIEVKDVICYTDIDNRNITVKFTGDIAEEYFTKDYFKLRKDGEIFTDYTVEKVSAKEALIKFVNKFDYASKYTVELSKDIKNKEKSMALDIVYIKEYDGAEAVEADITYENSKVNVYIKNNTNQKQNIMVMIGSYDDNNTLVGFELLERELNSGDVISEILTFDANGGKVQCAVVENLINTKLLYNEINLQ